MKPMGRAGRDTGALRQSAQKIDEPGAWKQEVTRRVAEHRERKVPANEQQAQGDGRQTASARAAEAAARVAARYAKAPSYSEMLAEEARAAVRAAEAASKAALQAQAVAEQVLAGLEAAAAPAPAWEEEFFTPAVAESAPAPATAVARKAAPARKRTPPAQVSPAAPERLSAPSKPSFQVRFDADMPVREPAPAAARASHGASAPEAAQGSVREAGPDVRSLLDTEGVDVVEPALPIHANLIQFPRELVATRKIRPRRAEGPYAAEMEAQGQLSIFEVEPGTISTEPAATGAAAEAGTAAWAAPKWSGIELEEEAPQEIASPAAEPARAEFAETAAEDVELQPAPLNRRVMASMVDFSLVTGAFLAAALLAAVNVRVLPAMREIELGSAVAELGIGLFYLAIFFIFGRGTPGMKYARLEMGTFAGRKPTRAQRCMRMGATVASLAPMGLGAVMAIFDEDHLAWHDRWSGTYLRKRQ